MKKVLPVLFLFYSSILYSQHIINMETSLMRDSDMICMQCVEPQSAGGSGMDVLWDFSMAETDGEPHVIQFLTDTLENHFVTENDRMYHYSLSPDSTFLLMGMENRLTAVSYDMPRRMMRYPFQYGDTLSSRFSGSGSSGSGHRIKVCGQTDVCADACGRLVLSEGDTLQALRIRSLTVTSMQMALDSIGDTGGAMNVKQEIEDSYDWYVRGYRYPLFKTVRRTSYSDMRQVASRSFSYRLLPDNFNIFADEENERILFQDSLERANGSQRDIIKYEISVSNGSVCISYTLKMDAQVTALLTDISGIIYSKESLCGTSGQPSVIRLGCARLRSGTYMLYLNVNGNIYSEKIIL